MARSEEEIDFASRQLCPDGACIGVLGANGRCKVCGKEGIRPTTSQQVDEVLDDHEVDDDDEPPPRRPATKNRRPSTRNASCAPTAPASASSAATGSARSVALPGVLDISSQVFQHQFLTSPI
jgi:BRCT domain type II-containing protein